MLAPREDVSKALVIDLGTLVYLREPTVLTIGQGSAIGHDFNASIRILVHVQIVVKRTLLLSCYTGTALS
jgi:hypothetical protein